jgi:hypothetical protein
MRAPQGVSSIPIIENQASAVGNQHSTGLKVDSTRKKASTALSKGLSNGTFVFV